MELDEASGPELQLQDHGGVDPGDQEAVGLDDGGVRLSQEAGGEHAQEAGRSH